MLTRRRLLLRTAQTGGALWAGRLLEPSLAASALPTRRHGSELWTFGGELQYFRSDPEHLEQRLAVCSRTGYTTIQTYVPWNVHESERGHVDFAGATSPVIVNDHVDQYEIETPDDQINNGGPQAQLVANTDLQAYLRTLAGHGFEVILRPGPFISNEWRNGGLPDWLLAAGFPDIYMCGPDGTPLTPGAPINTPPVSGVTGGGPLFYFPGPSYASARYLAESRRWLQAFAAFVKPWLATSGGPVVAIQVDDESSFYYRFGPFEVDYHPDMAARYRAEAGEDPPTSYPAPGGSARALAPAFRWQQFKARQIGEFLRTLATDLRDAGVDVPISHELELQLSPPAAFAASAAAVDVLHPEFYNGDSGPWSVPLNELGAGAVRAAQRQRKRVIAAEMQSGDALLYPLLVGEGLSGGLQFTYTDGVPESDLTDLARLGRTIRAAGPRLARAERRADTALVWCPAQLSAPYDSRSFGFARDVRNVGERDVPALATMLMRAGLAFDLLDTDVARLEDYRRYPTIWLAASDILPRAAQENLVGYVKSGGQLVCWPSPPVLDERLEPCTVLAEHLFTERKATFYADDQQEIRAFGTTVPVYRGVQTFALSRRARPLAFRAGEPCGYRRRVGRGEALLLGTWPAADSVAGRAGVVLEVEPVQPADAPARARALARSHFGDRAAAAVPDSLGRAGAGEPRYLVVFYNSNERRGGEVGTGGTVAYWDGSNVVPIVELNTATQLVSAPQPYGAQISTPPFRPLLEAHATLARRLDGRPPIARVTDPRAQVRVLASERDRSTTVTAVNRFPEEVRTAIEIDLDGRRIRLPERGHLTLSASSGLLMPVGYSLAHGVRIEQASAQLLDSHVRRHALELALLSPAGGDVVISLPPAVTSVKATGGISRRQARATDGRVRVRFALQEGEQTVRLTWRHG